MEDDLNNLKNELSEKRKEFNSSSEDHKDKIGNEIMMLEHQINELNMNKTLGQLKKDLRTKKAQLALHTKYSLEWNEIFNEIQELTDAINKKEKEPESEYESFPVKSSNFLEKDPGRKKGWRHFFGYPTQTVLGGKSRSKKLKSKKRRSTKRSKKRSMKLIF
jgi:hypothetical protein